MNHAYAISIGLDVRNVMTLWWDLCAVYVIPRHPTMVLFLERKMVSLPEKSLGEGGNEANLYKQTYREKRTKNYC